MLKIIPLLILIFSLFSCSAQEPQDSQNKVKPVKLDNKRPLPFIFIDTTIQELGKIKIYYDEKELRIKSWKDGDTIVGSTDLIFLEDTIVSKEFLNVSDEEIRSYQADIGIIYNDSLLWTKINYTDEGFLFFSIWDQWYRLNVYVATIVGNKWFFICRSKTSCSVIYSTAGCKILDMKHNRLLVKYPGTPTDPELDKEYERISIYQYSNSVFEDIGELRLRDWNLDHCDPVNMIRWYKAYEKIAYRDTFGVMYLDLPVEKK